MLKNRLHSTFTAFIACLLISGSLAPTGQAVYEGTANANMMIRRYERKGEFGKAALWHETAAKCLDMISIPLARILMEYCQRNKNAEIAQKMQIEIADTEARKDEHLRRARLNRNKAEETKEELHAESARIGKFIAEWVPHYPDRFYEFGTYRNVFRERIDDLRESGRFADALLVEADASDMCARQYEEVTIRYFRDTMKEAENAGNEAIIEESQRQLEAYQGVRDSHLRRSAMLRALATQKPESWPAAADERDFDTPKSDHRLTSDKAITLAREDQRIREILEEHSHAREYAWFQGFCWTVSYYSRDWGGLAIAFVDDETGKVTDVLTSPGDLEERETDEEEKEQSLSLSPDRVVRIARGHPKVQSYFRKYPEARASAAYNWQYNCWIVEVILDHREVGIVTVSDKTEAVLEVTLEQDRE